MLHLNKKQISLRFFVVAFVSTGLFVSCEVIPKQKPKYATIYDIPHQELPVIEAELTEPPLVPAPIYRKKPAKGNVGLEATEVEKKITIGGNYTFRTFCGTVPGKFIRIRQNNLVEFHLTNHPDRKNPHNIDLHAITWPNLLLVKASKTTRYPRAKQLQA